MTLMHEHIYLDLSFEKKDSDCLLNCQEQTIDELSLLRLFGISRLVEVTNRGMGRNVSYVQKVAKASGLEILFSTGWYKEPYLPPEVYLSTEKELAMTMIRELTVAIDDTPGQKASLIGEIGSSKETITPQEVKIFKAAAMAQQECGCLISTHTTLSTMAVEQLSLLRQQGANLSHVIIGHMDLACSLDICLKLLDEGVSLGFDTIGKLTYQSDEQRAWLLMELIARGYISQLCLSLDLTRKSHLKAFGGIGYSYLFSHFIPRLKKLGLSEVQLTQLLTDNPNRLLSSSL